jgi:esterase/lipase superfamily enzyme
MNERYIKWHTPYLSRELEMLVFGNGSGLPLILFPTSGARYYENKDFGLVGSVAGYIDSGKITFTAPTRSIAKVYITNRFIRPIGCGRTTPTKT